MYHMTMRNRTLNFFKLLCSYVVILMMSEAYAEPEISASDLNVEPQLINAMHHIRKQHLDEAIVDVRAVLEKKPKFHLAQLVYADLLMAKAILPMQSGLASVGATKERIEGLRDEARARWWRYQENIQDNKLPAALMQLSAKQKTAVLVDLSKSRLYLYENDAGSLRLLSDFYVTSGKNGVGKRLEGDRKTPAGVYFVTSSLDTKKLPDLYGTGAFPIDYPNAWDRDHGYTGYGIWLHGVPSNTYSRAPRASDGCLAMSNQELDAIKPFLTAGVTPVIIAEQLVWKSREALNRDRADILEVIEKWRQDWQSKNSSAYLSHYSKDFKSDSKNYVQWSAHKIRVNSAKTFIKVGLHDLSVFAYPEEKDMVVVSYRQVYESSNLSGERHKRQYWRKESDGKWRIIYEGKG